MTFFPQGGGGGGGGGAAVWGAITGTLSDQTDLQTAINTVQGKIGNWIVLEDQKAVHTPGGTFSSGSWVTRDLNTEVSDPNNNCSLASNEFTLSEGNYGLLIASAPAFYVHRHQIRLYRVSPSPDNVALGSLAYSSATLGNHSQTRSFIFFVIGTLANDTTFRVEHRCQTTKTDNGLGISSTWGTGVFTQVIIEDLN